MSDLDNTTALAENKVLILYILSKIENGISESGLFKIISPVNNVNYFYYKQVLTDLIDSKLVGTFTKNEEDIPVLKITSEGINSLSLTIDLLPGLLKLKADNIFEENIYSITNETSVIAEYTPRSENDYIVKCKIVENNETIFEVKTFAGSGQRAKKIVDNWNNNADSIYPQILNLLLENNNDIEKTD